MLWFLASFGIRSRAFKLATSVVSDAIERSTNAWSNLVCVASDRAEAAFFEFQALEAFYSESWASFI